MDRIYSSIWLSKATAQTPNFPEKSNHFKGQKITKYYVEQTRKKMIDYNTLKFWLLRENFKVLHLFGKGE